MPVFFIDAEICDCSLEFLFWTFTVITQWSLFTGLSMTFQYRIGCKEGNAIVRSIADFEVLDLLVCLQSF